jgi:hypothetical protein
VGQAVQPVVITRLLEVGAGGPQLLRADARGRVHLLDTSTLTVFPVGASGVPGKPRKLERQAGSPPLAFVTEAAACGDGSSWLLLTPTGRPAVRYFAEGKEQSLKEAPWMVTGVACPGGTPTVAVGPLPGRLNDTAAVQPNPHLLLQWTGGEWTPFLARVFDPLSQRSSGDVPAAVRMTMAASMVLIAPGTRGSAWVAHENIYNVRRVSAGGRTLTTLQDGPPRIEFRDRTSAEIAKLTTALREARRSPPNGGFGQVPRRSILGIGEAPDGIVYLLVAPRGSTGLAIDRYDPVQLRVQRVFVELPAREAIESFVAGADGLYVATPSVSNGAWWLPWEKLHEAVWESARRVEIR